MSDRVVCWFSAGAASAVATKLALADYGDRCVVVTIDPGSEHPDNDRFRQDCAEWYGYERSDIETLRSGRYADTWQVWEERRFLVGPSGALCTAELKKRPRFAFERPDDLQVFGYTAEEVNRAERFREQNPGVNVVTPLIERGLSKADCLAIVERAGIELPAMYQLGYRNNNCIGCVKGGMGYWNKIRVDFPDVFDRMAKLERSLGRTVNRESVVVGQHEEIGLDGEPITVVERESRPVWLDEMAPDRGNYATESVVECGVACQIAEVEIRSASAETGEEPT